MRLRWEKPWNQAEKNAGTVRRTLKKVLGLVLCLAMMLSIMVVGAGAAFTDQSDIDTKHTEAVDMCVALNIIVGFDNGSFKPNDSVTREQMAKMICILDNGGKEPQLATGNTFSDVAADRWSNKYIEACASRGVVVGIGSGKFAPAGKVTATQAAKMLLVELGYDDDLQQYSGSDWATKVNVDATKKGYYEDLEDIDVNAPLTREHAAQMVWNALQALEVDYEHVLTGQDGNLSSIVKPYDLGSTLMEDKYGAYSIKGTLSKFEYTSKDEEWTYTVNGREAVSATDYTDMFGQNVKMVVKFNDKTDKREALGIFEEDSVVLFDGMIGDLPNLANNDTTVKVDGVKYKFDEGTVADVPVYFFQHDTMVYRNATTLDVVAGKDAQNNNISAFDAYNFKAVDDDNDGKIDFLMVNPYIVAKVTYCVGSDIKLTPTKTAADQAIAARFGMTATTDKLEVGDDIEAYDGIAKNDYVVWTPALFTNNDTATVTKIDTLISGKVTMNDDPDFTVDGTSYVADASYGAAPDVGALLTDAVIVNGYMFDVDSTQKKDVKDFAVVVAIVGSNANGLNGDQAKLLFGDNTKKIVDLAELPNGIVAGDLVTFKINSDGEYKLTPAPATLQTSGYDFFGTDGSNIAVAVKAISNSSSKAGYVSGYYLSSDTNFATTNANIASDSVVFVAYKQSGNTYSYKAITGDQLKKISSSDFDNEFADRYVLGTKQSKGTNVYDVDLAYLSVGAKDVNDADTYYAYVTGSVQVENKDGDTVQQLTLWTKDGEKTVLTASSYDVPNSGYTIAMRDVIEYKLNSDGDLSEVVAWYDVDGSAYTAAQGSTNGYATVGITNWGDTVQFQALASGQTYTDGTNMTADAAGNYFEPDSDTEYLYIDNTDHAGQDAADIANADDHATQAGALQPNAFLVFDKDGALVLVVYDTDNDIIQ